jgi:hypothetical protein
MTKKGLFVLIIIVLAAAGAFAQSDFASMAKNTVTVDVGPTIAGLLAGSVGSKISSWADTGTVSDINLSGFSIAAQYERQLLRQLSVALRGVYGGYSGTFAYEQDGATAKPDIDLTSLAVEGHVRLYPFGGTFFLDGMLGYAQISTKLSGTVVAQVGSSSVARTASADEKGNYLKYGAKLGWRISFGKNGGLTFEPAIGYYMGAGLGDSLGKKVSAALKDSVGGYEVVAIDEQFSLLEKFVLVGGPRVTLAFGYRF